MLYHMFIPHNKKEREVVVEGGKKRKGEIEREREKEQIDAEISISVYFSWTKFRN